MEEEVVAGDEDVPGQETTDAEEEAHEPHGAIVVFRWGCGVNGSVPGRPRLHEEHTIIRRRHSVRATTREKSRRRHSCVGTGRQSRKGGAHPMRTLLLLFVACSLLCTATCASINSDYELQEAASSKSGGPGVTVKQWNATGANGQRTQFTLATISAIQISLLK